MNSSLPATSSHSDMELPQVLQLAQLPQLYRPIALHPTLFAPVKMEVLEENPVSLGTSSASSRCSSNESSSAPGKIRRGRPQQEIADGQDAHSQKKRHRRLYARQYRAQMRQKVENVKNLNDEKEQLEMEVKTLRQAVTMLQQEVAQRDFIINFMSLNQIKSA